MNKTKIGYACMNMDTRPSSFKTCRIDNISDKKLMELIQHNLEVLEAMIDYNIQNGNKMYRVSSSLIPFGSSELNQVKWKDIFSEDFSRIRLKIKKNDIRISTHPGQYTVINSKDIVVVERSIQELEYHAQIMDLLSGNESHKMILHVGGIYDDKKQSMDRFIEVYKNQLPNNVKKYLVIENDDRLYTVEDVLYIAKHTSIPVVFDNLHHECNPSPKDLGIDEIIKLVIATWPSGMTPKMHYSQQDKDKRMGAHSATINLDQFEKDYQNIYSLAQTDIMLEVKDKNRSFIKVNSYLKPSMKVLEKEWARYKYLVMAHSIHSYNLLRSFFSNNQIVDTKDFYRAIDDAMLIEASIESHINAMDHVFGYFKKIYDTKERDFYLRKREDFRKGLISHKPVIRHLQKMAIKYEKTYLIESYYFDSLL